MRTISIFGSTGSIGDSCLDVIRNLPSDQFSVLSLVANTNYQKLAQQAIEFAVKLVVIREEKYYIKLKSLLANTNIKVVCGESGIIEACALKSDLVVGAIVGIAGLIPVYNAILAGSDILLANKESLVCAGGIIMNLAQEKNVKIIPVDSEHNAISQVFDGAQKKSINKIILTASGGPFRGKSKDELKEVKLDDALKHPTWKMGKKITIDSATMFNKGLEIIEAHYLFGMDIDDIEVIVHPQSIIHSMVEYKDGSVLAQLSKPDMKIPILNSLYYPRRYSSNFVMNKMDFTNLTNLTFEQVNHEAFPSINYAKDALRKGGVAQVMLNAANEVLVECFLERRIGFYSIFETIAYMLSQDLLCQEALKDIDGVISFDKYCRDITYDYIKKHLSDK
ncbi:MAG: 1-deoxy-D-xylulose-5-phosphate reductoisomerase [Rickettsiales bacterium]|nr:1-deoxy-D-xylulose-5-phosphate reductoisomerase [Rickettsiales bacterium]